MSRTLKRTNKGRKSKVLVKKFPAKWLVVLSIFICELFFYTGTRLECLQIKYRISRAMEEIQKKEAYKKALVIELDRLSSPERISRIARTRLALAMPDHERVIYLDQH